MTFRTVHLGQPNAAKLDALLVQAQTSELTYDHARSTVDLRPGQILSEHQLVLGTGDACFRRAVDRLRAWAPHHTIGALVHPSDAPVELGSTVLVVLPAGPFSIVVPDRIVAIIEAPRRVGFAYGTLEGHHERGEELFLIEHRQGDEVRATIRIDATEATLAARLAHPLVHRFQRRAAEGYLRGLAD